MSINVPDIKTLSPALKSIRKFLLEAARIERVDQRSAYLCRLHAVQQGFALQRSGAGAAGAVTDTDKAYLLSLLDWLENNNAVVAGLAPEDKRAHLSALAARIFLAADDTDKRGEADDSTAKAYFSAATFWEAALQLAPDAAPGADGGVEERMRYALVRVQAIRAATKAGQKPPPPPAPPGSEDELAAAFAQLGTNVASPASAAAPSSSSLPASAAGASASSSLSPYPPAYPSAYDAPQQQAPAASPYPAAYPSAYDPPQPQHQHQHQQQPQQYVSPSQAQQQHPQHQPQHQHQQQYPSAHPAAQPQYPPASAPAHSTYPPAHAPVQQQQYPPAGPSPAASSGSYPPAASPAAGARNVTGRASALAPLTVTPAPPAANRSVAMREADRVCKHASSALAFDDVPTAIDKLRQALAALLPYEFEAPAY